MSGEITRGSRVTIRNAYDEHLDCWALTGVIRGHNFPIIWVTAPEDAWSDDLQPGDEGTYPWPASDVWAAKAGGS
jgi:hypothetical protein